MIARRDLVTAALCLGAAGAAYALKPRRHVSLVGSAKLDDVVPHAFGDWVSRDVSDPVALNTEDSLSAKLYNQMLTRAYQNRAGTEILVLLAYGAVQTDDLQLHRPEVCYPAFGYKIVSNEVTSLRLPHGALLPARHMVAAKPNYLESIVYWTRIGEDLPVDGNQQRKDKLVAALSGIIPDGVLCRFSCSNGADTNDIKAFISLLLTAMAPNTRQMLIGSGPAAAMRGAPAATPSPAST